MAATFLAIVALPAPAGAQAARRLTLHSLDGTPVVRAELQRDALRVPGFLVIDLGTRGPLLIHTRSAAILDLTGRGAVDVRFTDTGVHLPRLDAVALELEPLETLTRDHAETLASMPVVGVVGLPAFAGQRILLDLDGGELRFGPDAAGPASENTSEFLPFEAEGYGYWLRAEGPDGTDLRVRLTTGEYDTRIDAGRAAALGHPGGDLPRVTLAGVNLAEYAVLRPSDLGGFPEPRPDVTLGTGFLAHFQTEIRVDALRLRLVPLRAPRLKLAERALFVARAAADADGVEDYLRTRPDGRLAAEASEALLALRLDAEANERDAIRRALEWRARTAPPRRRAETLVRVADELIALEETRDDALELAALAVEVGRAFARDDLNATAVHQLNARVGLIALLQEDYDTARRLLLSAVFALPEDPYVNLWLGRLYEQTDQPVRAWSRYAVAALADNPLPGALRGLDRLNEDPTFRRDFSMQKAALLLEGRTPRFAVVEQITPDAPGAPRLVELFSSTAQPETQAAELAFEALLEYLEPAPTVLVQYHVGDGLVSPASAARAEAAGVGRTPLLVVDGHATSRAGGDDRAVAGVFAAYRETVDVAARDRETGPAALAAHASLRGERLQAEVHVTGPKPAPAARLQVLLCEQRVMAIGPNRVPLHRNVVRGALEPARGHALAGTGEPYAFEVRLSDVQSDVGTPDSAPPGSARLMRPAYMDIEACTIVALLADAETGRIHAAVSAPVTVLSRETP